MQTEVVLGVTLPEDFKASYRLHNGGYPLPPWRERAMRHQAPEGDPDGRCAVPRCFDIVSSWRPQGVLLPTRSRDWPGHLSHPWAAASWNCHPMPSAVPMSWGR